jgi:transcriptional regulator, TetR family
LENHVYPLLADDLKEAHPSLPASYLQHLVVTNFTETLIWWLKKGQDFTEQEVVQFYLDFLIPKN